MPRLARRLLGQIQVKEGLALIKQGRLRAVEVLRGISWGLFSQDPPGKGNHLAVGIFDRVHHPPVEAVLQLPISPLDKQAGLAQKLVIQLLLLGVLV